MPGASRPGGVISFPERRGIGYDRPPTSPACPGGVAPFPLVATMSSLWPGPRPTNVRWLVVLLLTGFTFLAHFNRVSISVAGNAHFIGPGKLSEEQMGLVYS